MIVVSVEAIVLVVIAEDGRLQWIRPSQVLFPFDLYQDLGSRNKERGVIVGLINEASWLGDLSIG